MIRFFIFLFFALPLFAFDSVEILNPAITVYKSGYFKTDKELSPQEALEIVKKGELKELPKKAVSFGFDKNIYWFLFEVSTTSNKQLFLDSKNMVGTYQDLYIFDENSLIKTQKSGYFTPIEQRPVKTFPIRFELENEQKKLTYILKVKSKSPHYTAFAFGEEKEVDRAWFKIYLLLATSGAIFLAFIVYNAFLYIALRDKAYLYYCVYIMGFFGLIFVALGNIPLIQEANTIHAHYYYTISSVVKFTGLTFFAIHFLRLKEQQNRLRQIFIVLLSINIILSMLYTFGVAKPLYALSVQALLVFSIFAAIVSYIKGFKPALFYLVATGIGNAIFMGFVFMNQGVGIPYSIWSLNLSSFAMVWDLIMLSLALAYRVRLLQDENIQNERMLLLSLRRDSVGQMSGNIAHQWRTPLSELGASITKLEAKVKYAELQRSELLDSLERQKEVIKYLSNTIDVFQEFFHPNRCGLVFSVSNCIQKTVSIVESSLRENYIKIEYRSVCDCEAEGDGNEFVQALLSLIVNAKDAILKKGTQGGRIKIDLIIDGSKIIVTIEDNGGGINKEIIKNIFEPYVSDKEGGTGVGLYIAKTIIEKHFDGKISARNTQSGARFEITLQVYAHH